MVYLCTLVYLLRELFCCIINTFTKVQIIEKSWPIHYKKGPSNFIDMGPWAHTLLFLGNTLYTWNLLVYATTTHRARGLFTGSSVFTDSLILLFANTTNCHNRMSFFQVHGVKLVDTNDRGDVTTTLDKLSLANVESHHPSGARVTLDDSGLLHWPVLFLYPEHGETDYIMQFSEKTRCNFIMIFTQTEIYIYICITIIMWIAAANRVLHGKGYWTRH